MKSVFTVLCFSFCMLTAFGQTKQDSIGIPDPNKKIQIVETSCGQCKLGLPGKSCDLAVRINGKAYFVDGTTIDEHGDAHAKDGFCNAIQKAEVQGEIIGDRFKVTYFKLIPVKKKKTAVHH
jgi:Family of unknown function (DUF6370)